MEDLNKVTPTLTRIMIDRPPDLNAPCLRMAPFVFTGILIILTVIGYFFLFFIFKLIKIKVKKKYLLLISFIIVELLLRLIYPYMYYKYFVIPIFFACI